MDVAEPASSKEKEKSSKRIWLVVCLCLILVALLSVGGYFLYLKYFKKKPEEKPTVKVESLKLDPEKEATHFSNVAGTEDTYFVRGFDVVWNSIEPEKGKFDWEETDVRMSDDMGGEVYFLSIIWPYANWDQKTCHSGEKYKATGHLKRGGEDLYMGAPCDMKAYADFLRKVVERYDGDGVDDMPGLKTPIKYWEILNEPSMQGGQIGGAGEDLKFFVGTPQEYLGILKTSHEAIKRTDPSAKVAHAGMAGMQEEFVKFWDPIFAAGAGNYFDIANIHSISTTERTEDLFVIKFKEFLKKYGIEEKPIWVTEAQYGDLQDKPKNLSEFEKLMARSSIFALAQGADKIFLIENWTRWDEKDAYKEPEIKDKEEGVDYQEKKEPKEPKPKIDLSANTTHKVYLNLIKMVNKFDKVEKLNEKYVENQYKGDGATSQIGQYKFTYKNKAIYVLWGQAALPAEITGIVKVTDIYGTSKEVDSSAITLSDSPVFVELK